MIESVKVNNVILKDNKLQIKNLSICNPKKMTGTNLAAILGVNAFKTPFQVWCDMMRVSKEYFDENDPKLSAGRTIEPIQAQYIKQKYNLTGLVSPVDRYGENYLQNTGYNFFQDSTYFQGMWDYLNEDPNTKELKTVIEMKTTGIKNKSKWLLEGIPKNYLLQAGLYAYLLGIDKAVFVVSFLTDDDYANPDKFKPNEDNTYIIPVVISRQFGDFYNNYIIPAIEWWQRYIVAGISPEYNEKNKGDKELYDMIEKETKHKVSFGLDDIYGQPLPFY